MALRIDIMQGGAAQALPQVETRLLQVEAWWRQHLSSQPVPEAPDPEFLARVLISALYIAKDAHFAQKDWEPALRRIDAILKVKRALQRPAEDIAGDRMNRANILRRLRRFAEAKAVLEVCLQAFENDPAKRAAVLSSLADLFDEQGDVTQAIIQERRASPSASSCPIPATAPSRTTTSPTTSNAPAFRPPSPNPAAGVALAVPRLAELLADPAFRPLDDWLRQRQVNLPELQATLDQLLDQVRQSAR